MKIKERIKQRIKEKRGAYTRARRKRFLYLKRLGLYGKQKVEVIPKLKQIPAKLTFWKRFCRFIKRLFR